MAKQTAHFIINLSIDGAPAVPVGKAISLQSAIEQIKNVQQVSQEIYKRGYGDNPDKDIYTVYDDKQAITRYSTKHKGG